MGKILAICTSPKRGTVKTEVPSAVLTPEWGIVSDAHGGNWHRQVSLLANESVDRMRKEGLTLAAGDFAENILTEGITLRTLPVGTVLRAGEVREDDDDYASVLAELFDRLIKKFESAE